MKTLAPMNSQTAGYLIIFGVFAILLGVIGYQTHGEDAVTALLFRGGFGALLILCGILGTRGVRLGWLAALCMATLFGLGCVWRSGEGWFLVANGQTERVFASLLSTLMLAVSGVVLWLLLGDRKSVATQKPGQHAR